MEELLTTEEIESMWDWWAKTSLMTGHYPSTLTDREKRVMDLRYGRSRCSIYAGPEALQCPKCYIRRSDEEINKILDNKNWMISRWTRGNDRLYAMVFHRSNGPPVNIRVTPYKFEEIDRYILAPRPNWRVQHTQKEAGIALGLQDKRVGQIEAKAVRKIKSHMVTLTNKFARMVEIADNFSLEMEEGSDGKRTLVVKDIRADD